VKHASFCLAIEDPDFVVPTVTRLLRPCLHRELAAVLVLGRGLGYADAWYCGWLF